MGEYLVCNMCHFPLVFNAELISDKIASKRESVYPYELDLCCRNCWCYSVTNDDHCRFDLLRVIQKTPIFTLQACAAGEDWFTGYTCHRVFCPCSQHLGWAFLSEGVLEGPDIAKEHLGAHSPAFYGLIITNLKLMSLTHTVAQAERSMVRTMRPSEGRVSQTTHAGRILSSLVRRLHDGSDVERPIDNGQLVESLIWHLARLEQDTETNSLSTTSLSAYQEFYNTFMARP